MDKAPDAFRTISEVAEDLDLPQHVLRFWETRFAQIKPMKRGGGRRYYRPEDVDLLRGIRHLLYGEGYTIRGVQRILKDNGVRFVQSVWKEGAPQPSRAPGDFDAAEVEERPPSRDVPGGGEDAGKSQASRSRRLFASASLAAAAASEDDGADGEPEGAPVSAGGVAPSSVAGQRGSQRAQTVAERAATPVSARGSENDAARRPGTLPRDDLRKLQAALFELGECRRLVDAAMAGAK